MRIRIAGLMAVLLLSATPVAAQDTDESRWSFGGTVGAGRTWDDEGSIGKGWLIGGYADWRVIGRLHLEFSADLLTHDRPPAPAASFTAEGKTTYLSTAALWRFGSPRANAFILTGGTLGIHRGKAGVAGAPLNESNDVSPGLIFGGGMTFRAGRTVEISPVVRMTFLVIDDDLDPFSSVMGGIRIGFAR